MYIRGNFVGQFDPCREPLVVGAFAIEGTFGRGNVPCVEGLPFNPTAWLQVNGKYELA